MAGLPSACQVASAEPVDAGVPELGADHRLDQRGRSDRSYANFRRRARYRQRRTRDALPQLLGEKTDMRLSLLQQREDRQGMVAKSEGNAGKFDKS